MMNISILHYAAPPVVGGVESTIYHHSRLLRDAGYPVSVIAGRGESFADGISVYIIPEIDSRHPAVLEAGLELAQGDVSINFIDLRDILFHELSKLLDHADVLIVHNAITLHKNLALTAALKQLSDSKDFSMIAWCHDFAWQDSLYTPDLHSGYPWDLLRTPWRNVQYVAVSEHRKSNLADLLSIPEQDILVIPPGIDVDQILKLSPLSSEMVNQLDLLGAEPLLLLPARLTRRKNIEFAIHVVACLKQSSPQVAMVITGPPGPHNPKNIAYLNSLLKLRKELGVENKIHFLYEYGDHPDAINLPDDVIADYYKLSDILLFPSFREGFGIPILEAGVTRLPIFASDIPPIQESSSGLINLVDPDGDPAKVAENIQAFIDSDHIYQLKRRVLSKYTWQSIIEHQIIPLMEGKVFTQ